MELSERHCTPCEGGVPPLSATQEDELLHDMRWEVVRDGVHRIRRQFRFPGFREAMGFVNRVAETADREGHHPDLCVSYNRVTIELHTHAVQGLSENDFILAAKIDGLLEPQWYMWGL